MWTAPTLKLFRYKKDSILVHNLFPLKGILWRWTLVFLTSEGGLGGEALQGLKWFPGPFSLLQWMPAEVTTWEQATWGGGEELSGLPCCQDGNRARLPFFFSSSIVPWSWQSLKEQVGRRPHNLSIMPHMIENDNNIQQDSLKLSIEIFQFFLKNMPDAVMFKAVPFFPHKKSVDFKTFSLLG